MSIQVHVLGPRLLVGSCLIGGRESGELGSLEAHASGLSGCLSTSRWILEALCLHSYSSTSVMAHKCHALLTGNRDPNPLLQPDIRASYQALMH